MFGLGRLDRTLACAGPGRQRCQQAVSNAARIRADEQAIREPADETRKQLMVALEAAGREDHGASAHRPAVAVRGPRHRSSDRSMRVAPQLIDCRFGDDSASGRRHGRRQAFGEGFGVEFAADLRFVFDRQSIRDPEPCEPCEARADSRDQAPLPLAVATSYVTLHYGHRRRCPDRPAR